MLLVWLVLFCVSQLNTEPSSTSIDDYSPREIFLGRALNYKRDLRIGYGDYAQVQVSLGDSEYNTLESRTEGAIAVWPTGNLQSGVKFFLLGSHRIVTRDQWVPLPMPPPVIEYLNKLADKYPVSRDPQFIVGNRALDDDIEADPLDSAHAAAISDGPLCVIPNQNDLAHFASEPSTDPPTQTTVVEAATDQTAQATSTVEPVADVPIDVPTKHQTNEPTDHPTADTASEHGVPDDGVTEASTAEPTPAPTHGYNTRRGARKDYSTMHSGGRLRTPECHYGLHISVNKALNKLGRTALHAMLDEMIQFHCKGVGKPIHKRDLTFQQLKSVIRSSMFLKEKYLSTGEFEKLKARLVAGGDQQDKAMYEDVTSPTVATAAFFMAAAIAARENRHVATVDIGGAFLNAEMGHHNVYMSLDPLLAAIFKTVDGEYQEFMNDDGTIIVKLSKVPYGCVQSSKLWYEHLCGTLLEMGFIRNPLDPERSS